MRENPEVLNTLLALQQVQEELQAHPRWEELRSRLEGYLQVLSQTQDPETRAAICLDIEDLVAGALGARWWEIRAQVGTRVRGLSSRDRQALESLARFFGLPGLVFIPPEPDEDAREARDYCCPRCGYRAARPGRCPEHDLKLRPCEGGP